MQLFTGCPHCGKAIEANLKHKEAWVPPEGTRPVAVIQCDKCRTEINVLITLTAKG